MQDNNVQKIFLNLISSGRRVRTREVQVGTVPLGGGHPVRLQSMVSSPTMDTEACVEESIRIIRAGADYVRFTAQNVAEAENLANIRDMLRRRGYATPLIADVHFNPAVAETAARLVEKVRINPGNFVRVRFPSGDLSPQKKEKLVGEQIRSRLVPLLQLLKKHGAALRIGVNHGSLAPRIVEAYGDTPRGMVVAAMEYLRICREEGFHEVVLSMKSSNARVMVQGYRLLVAAMAAEGGVYPLHLGITEAGEGGEGRIKSATGIGALLADGLGDTIRVSLTEPSEREIPVARTLAHLFSHRHEEPREPLFPASFLPFEYRPPAVSGIEGISREPVVVAPEGYPEGEELQPDLFFLETEKDHLFTRDGKKIAILTLPAGGPPPSPAEAAGKVLVAEAVGEEGVRTLRSFFARLEEKGINNPVIIKKSYDTTDEETFRITAAADLGPLFLDGYGQGIWIRQKAEGRRQKLITHHSSLITAIDTSFAILQAARVRTTRPEYISCPSCGRTLFDIQEVTARIRARTAHLKGVKIAIMGCIVNGPGEMADAHYGYVGAAPGRITLYRNKEVVKKNIPAEDAVEELIRLIKEQGDWKDDGAIKR
jgi:(E)-4-hydroxy-3-methylbut-2-enyl-diphosphate synthase